MTHPVNSGESCQDPIDSSISMHDALAIITGELQPITGAQSLVVRQALGRYLAEPVISPMNVPAHLNSAMDGYALSGQALPSSGRCELTVIGTAYAGRPFAGEVAAGECVRVMTGAKIPAGCDTVVIQEQVERDGDSVVLDDRHQPGQNVRQPGEDIARDRPVLEAGQRLGPAELGLLASLGIAEVRVRRRVRVALFSSGDEIRSIGEPLAEGQIYDSNRYTLYGMLSELGAEVIDLGVIPDREVAIGEALQMGATQADLVLTSGGVSVGEADFIVAAMRRLGQVLFNKVAIKPGRPLTFGRIGDSHFFGLPGNPVAVMITLLQFVRPALLRLSGAPVNSPAGFKVRCLSPLRKNPGRVEIQRGILSQQGDEWVVESTGRQGSGVLSSMSQGNCFILLDEAQGHVAVNQQVTVQPFALFYR